MRPFMGMVFLSLSSPSGRPRSPPAEKFPGNPNRAPLQPRDVVAMNRTSMPLSGLCWLLLSVFLFVFVLNMASHAIPGAPANQSGNAAQIARGNILSKALRAAPSAILRVTKTAIPIPTILWNGAAVWIKPASPSTDWPLTAPRIAGTLPASDADMVRLLTTGIWQNGQTLRQPMPQFRMTKEDAESVIAYLRSLHPAPHLRSRL